MSWNIEWAMVSDKGVTRKDNQDAALFWLPSGSCRLPIPGSDQRSCQGSESLPANAAGCGAIAMIADGMGGPPGGDQASQILVDTALTLIERSAQDDPHVLMNSILDTANQAIFDKAAEVGMIGMGSTGTLLTFTAGTLRLCHVGDSRCYRILPEQGSMSQWSQDQNLAAELVAQGVLTPEEARNHRASHTLTQAVGLGKPLKPQVETATLGTDRPEMLVLCSDGLLRVVEDDELLCAFLPQSTPASTAEGLVDLANRRGSPDNVSILVVKIAPQ